MLQLFSDLPKNAHYVGAGRVAIWAAARDDGRSSRSQHSVQAAVFSDQMFDVEVAFVVVAHGSSLLYVAALASAVAAGFTVRTGHFAFRTTSSATLPIRSRMSPVRPC